MAERFLDLGRGDRADILQSLAAQFGRTAVALEMDVWVCWRGRFTLAGGRNGAPVPGHLPDRARRQP